MKIAVVIPDRGDRPIFTQQCLNMLKEQTRKVDLVIHVNEKTILPSEGVDITPRYRYGYECVTKINERLTESKIDVIAFFENDDYYAPTYLEWMLAEWDHQGRPDLFGTTYTHYYHLRLRKYFTMNHAQRSSAMNMLIKPGLKITWPQDEDPFTDQFLWLREQTGIRTRGLCTPHPIISFGVKHGVGLTVRKSSHVDELHRYTQDDAELKWLQKVVAKKDFGFYKNYSEQLILENLAV